MIQIFQKKFTMLMVLGMLLVACERSQISVPSTSVSASVTPTSTVTQPQAEKTTTKKPPEKLGTVIGHAIDCDNDGQDNDFRVDYDDDGIPDDCIIGEDSLINTENTNSQDFYATMNYLEQLTQGCEEKTKIDGDITYVVCLINGRPVKASEFLTEFGDGLSFWFEQNHIKAVQRSHTGELFLFDNGQLTAKFAEYGSEASKIFSTEELGESQELAQTAYRKIFAAFNISEF